MAASRPAAHAAAQGQGVGSGQPATHPTSYHPCCCRAHVHLHTQVTGKSMGCCVSCTGQRRRTYGMAWRCSTMMDRPAVSAAVGWVGKARGGSGGLRKWPRGFIQSITSFACAPGAHNRTCSNICAPGCLPYAPTHPTRLEQDGKNCAGTHHQWLAGWPVGLAALERPAPPKTGPWHVAGWRGGRAPG